LVLSVMQKQYEAYEPTLDIKGTDAAEESDDSATKHSEFVAPSPEGNHVRSPYEEQILTSCQISKTKSNRQSTI
jgi:hypothetical protein